MYITVTLSCGVRSVLLKSSLANVLNIYCSYVRFSSLSWASTATMPSLWSRQNESSALQLQLCLKAYQLKVFIHSLCSWVIICCSSDPYRCSCSQVCGSVMQVSWFQSSWWSNPVLTPLCLVSRSSDRTATPTTIWFLQVQYHHGCLIRTGYSLVNTVWELLIGAWEQNGLTFSKAKRHRLPIMPCCQSRSTHWRFQVICCTQAPRKCSVLWGKYS